MPTRLLWGTECTDSKRRRSFISASRPSSSLSKKRRCSPDCRRGRQYYSPINHPDRALKRRNLVINAMLEDGKITAAQAADARSAPLVLHLAHDPNSLAPYFVEEIRRYLENKYGADQVHEGGLKVYTIARRGSAEGRESGGARRLGGLRTPPRMEGPSGKCCGRRRAVSTNTRIPTGTTNRKSNGYVHALVTSAGTGIATLKFGRYTAALGQADVAWTQQKLADILKAGDICYVKILVAGRERRGPRQPGAGFRRAGLAARHRQRHRRNQGDGRRTRLQRIEIRPRHPGACGRSGRRSSHTSTRRSSTKAPVPTTRFSTSPSALKRPRARTLRTTTTKNLKASSRCGARWRSRAIFRR